MKKQMVIIPYWDTETWVFDDETVNLQKEPFVSGIPEMIDELVKNIPNARKGFKLTFSEYLFPGVQKILIFAQEESGGAWYQTDDRQLEGWLCPMLYRYFDKAPQKLYLHAGPLDAATTCGTAL